MPKLKPWYKVVTPSEDLREGKPLDASEFAVHLDQVRDGRANEDYQNPVRFFERTLLTKSLRQMAGEVVRRLSGEKTETSAIFNMATQFGGGKTHALTLLYHLASHGPKADKWPGVSTILEQAGIREMPEAGGQMREEARKLIAWEDIKDESLSLDEPQRKQLDLSIKRGRCDFTESVWRTYKNVMYLDKENQIETMDLGLVTSSAAESLTKLILSALRQKDIVAKEVPPRYLVRNWPPAFTEWSTKAVRDAFFASPQFPRLLYPDTIKETIARGVSEGHIAYAAKSPKEGYAPFLYKTTLDASDVEISEDIFILTSAEAEKHIEPPQLTRLQVSPERARLKPGMKQTFTVEALDQFGHKVQTGDLEWNATGGVIEADGVFTAGPNEGNFIVSIKSEGKVGTAEVTIAEEQTSEPEPPPLLTGPQKLTWSGELAPQKWTNLYMKVLTKLVSGGDLKIRVSIEATLKEAAADQQVEETKAALRGLGLDDNVETK
ncbi:MAG: hypothetical protein U9N58_02550 [Thermodesulfobacteriota bacterium]|nr:hypothetical protein [Thermodesulfobacteriota bacterium]